MRNFSRTSLISLTISLAWLLLISLAYVYTHKAISPEMLLTVSKNAWVLALAVFFLGLCGGLGREILNRFARPHPGTLPVGEDTSLSSGPFLALAIGLGAFSLFVLLAGVFIAANGWVFGLLTLALLSWLWRQVVAFWRQVGRAWRGLAPAHGSEKSLAFFAAVILLLNLSVALAPPLAFDALVYHLALPLRYLQQGQITYLPEIMFWGMPQLAEMLYLVMLALGGESAPAVLGWLLGGLTLLALGDYLRQIFDRPAAWFGIAALLSGFTFSRLLGAAYLEWFLLFYALVWWQLLEKVYSGAGWRGDVLWFGVVAGLALSLKYTAGVLVLLGGLALLFQPGGNWRRNFSQAFLFGALATLVSLPWWIKNFAFTGNPFYPLLFPAGAMDTIRYDFYHNLPSSLTCFQAVSMPWFVTIWGVEGKVGPSASIGPLLLAFWPLAYLNWYDWNDVQKRIIRLATWMLLLGFVIWTIAAFLNQFLMQTRLFVVLFPLWAVLASAGFQSAARLKVGTTRLQRIALAISLLFFGFNLSETLSEILQKNAQQANFGLLSREAYLMGNLPPGLYQASEIIQQLPPGSRVVMLWETRSFYCAPVCDPDEVIDHWYHEARLHNSAGEIQTAWLKQGYTHMLIWESGFEFVRDFDNAKFNQRDWLLLGELRETLGPGQQIGSYTLYPLR